LLAGWAGMGLLGIEPPIKSTKERIELHIAPMQAQNTSFGAEGSELVDDAT
jgi:hypothetical protein